MMMTNVAYFAEIDSSNKVLRVQVACPIDVANNGGNMSEQAAENFKKITALSIDGVKWVQTCKNNSFRKQYAGIGYTFDSTKNKFIAPQPFTSWSLDANDDWQAPILYPNVSFIDNNQLFISWDELNQCWVGEAISEKIKYKWNSETLNWSLL